MPIKMEKVMKIRKAVIPAAGKGTRLLPLTMSCPKEMLPVGRKPVILYVVEEILNAGIEYILIINTYDKRSIEEILYYNKELAGRIFFVQQIIEPSMPYGLAHAIKLSEGFVSGDPFVVCLGDCIIKSDYNESPLKCMIDAHIKYNSYATILFEEVPWDNVNRYGIAKPSNIVGNEFLLEDIIEKPSKEKAYSNLAVSGRYVFNPEIFRYIDQTKPGKDGELQLTDSIKLLISYEYQVFGVKLKENEKRYDIGNLLNYFKAFFDFSISDESFGEELGKYIMEKVIWKKVE